MNDDFDENTDNAHESGGWSWWFSGRCQRRAAGFSQRRRRQTLSDRLLAHPGRLTIAYFADLIVIVTLLLLLPVSSRQEGSTDASTAFFTAVSALSTCGIPVVDMAEHWTAFGQAIILVSIQLGGLGVMTFSSIIALFISRHLNVTQRLLTASELGTTKLSEIKAVLQVVAISTFCIEAITMLALFPGLFSLNDHHVGRTLWEALFYAVSSYNNTGFTPDATGLHVQSWAVGLPVLVAAFIGTLGYPVILDLTRCARRHDRPRKWSLNTKITLVTTFALVGLNLVWFLVAEWNNTAVFAQASLSDKLRGALSAAVMPRSSGFDLSWVGEVSDPTKTVMSAMMFIGGGSSSTAGGIRVTTFAVLMLICRAAFTGHSSVTVFRRRLPERTLITAVSVTIACFALVSCSAIALMIATGRNLTDTLFEACSAFSLGGYTLGVASADNPVTLFILAAAMIVGRLGPMTIAYAINRPRPSEPIDYPQENIVVG